MISHVLYISMSKYVRNKNNVAKMAVETTSVNPVTTAWHPEDIEPKMLFDYAM